MRIARAFCCLCLPLTAAPAAAQTVRVTVQDAASGAPVPAAMVRVEDAFGALARAGFSDARGEVRLRLDEPGQYAVSATRAGYHPAAETLAVLASGTASATLRLQARALALDTVTVVGTPEREEGRHTFERRRATANGVYLDSAYVAQRRATYPGDLLYSIPGIEVRADNRTGYRSPVSRMGSRCLVMLVNGLPFYGGWPRFVRLEETLRRTDVVAVEVYREFSEVPAELRRYAMPSDPCGVVVYWTEDGWTSAFRGADPDG